MPVGRQVGAELLLRDAAQERVRKGEEAAGAVSRFNLTARNIISSCQPVRDICCGMCMTREDGQGCSCCVDLKGWLPKRATSEHMWYEGRQATRKTVSENVSGDEGW